MTFINTSDGPARVVVFYADLTIKKPRDLIYVENCDPNWRWNTRNLIADFGGVKRLSWIKHDPTSRKVEIPLCEITLKEAAVVSQPRTNLALIWMSGHSEGIKEPYRVLTGRVFKGCLFYPFQAPEGFKTGDCVSMAMSFSYESIVELEKENVSKYD